MEDPTKVGQFVDVKGVKSFYRSAGAGAPFLLLHGFPTSSYDWREFLGPISKFGRVIAPDIPGFGHSESSKEIDPNKILRNFVPDFVSAMSIDNFGLFAYDVGGSLALDYAIRNPSRVTRLVIMNAAVYPDWIGHARTSQAYAPIRRMMNSAMTRRIFLALMSRGRVQQILAGNSGVRISDEVLGQQSLFIKRGFRSIAAMRPAPYTEPFFKILEDILGQLEGQVKGLKVPTLIIFGKNDPFIPSGTAEHLHGDLAESELHMLEGTGHFLLEERPQQVLGLIEAFLSKKG